MSQFQTMRSGWIRALGSLAVLLMAAALAGPASAQVFDDRCTATILNRTVTVSPDGFYIIPNIPLPAGAVRVRVVCEQDGQTFRGATPFIVPVANQFVQFDAVSFDLEEQPIPVSLALTAPASTLTPAAPGAQIVATGTLFDGTEIDVTLADTGTSYLSSNPTIASVSGDGFVDAVTSGNVLVTATNEGVIATIGFLVDFDQDADDDGLPDDFEAANAANPGGANLSRLPGTVARASSFLASRPPALAIDGRTSTSWFTRVGDAANQRTVPFLEVELPQDGNVAQIRVFGNRSNPVGFDFFAGVFTAFDAAGTEVFNSGVVQFPGPDRDAAVAVDLDGIRRVRFTATDDEGTQPGLSELQLVSRPGGQGLDPGNPDDALLDFDLDGLTNLDEFNLGTSIFLADTDGDGLRDSEELLAGSNPLLADTDNDGLLDGDEVSPSADTDRDGIINLLDPDSDGDLLPDGIEVQIGTDPLRTDTNFNGIPDGSEDGDLDFLPNLEEVFERTDPANPDTDGDGILDGQEVIPGEDGFVTDPLRPDTDGDGMPDGYESRFGLDPTDPNDANLDPDNDGLTNLEESGLDTDPFNDDVAAPGVDSTEPADAEMDVDPRNSIIVRFTETMRPDSINADNLRLFALDAARVEPFERCDLIGTLVDAPVALSQDELSATLNPPDQLDGETVHCISIENVRDTAGNLLPALVEAEFETGLNVDEIRPDVLRVTPVNNAIDVPTNAPFTIEFDERIDPATLIAGDTVQVRDNITNLLVDGLMQVDPGGRFASFVPTSPYAVSRRHTVSLTSGITDRAGNTLPFHSFAFTTAFQQDVERPFLIGTSPRDGALNVPVNGLVVLEFDEPVTAVGAIAGIRVRAGGEIVPGSIALSDANRRVTFTSEIALAPNTPHTVSVGTQVTDLAGLPLSNPTEFSFLTTDQPDLTNPSVATFNPPSNSGDISRDTQITIVFSERINGISANESAIQLRENIGFSFIPGEVAVAPNLLSAIFTPDEPLDPFTSYTWIINGSRIEDLSGRTVGGFSRNFTTGAGFDTTPPFVEAVSPVDGQTEVGANAQVRVLISETPDLLTVDASDLEVFDGVDPVAGSFSVSGRTLIFVPDERLPAATTFTVEVGGFDDRAGNPIADFSSSFTTGAVPGGNLGLAETVAISASSQFSSSFVPTRGSDGDLNTEWCTGVDDAVNRGGSPFWQMDLPGPASVDEIRIFGRRSTPNTPFLSVRFQLFAADDTELFDSGEVALPAPDRDATVATGGVAGVTRVLFTSILDDSRNPCFSELQLIGAYDDPTIGVVDDDSRPFLTAIDPPNGSGGAPAEQIITLDFSEPLDPTSVNSSTFPITIDGISGSIGGSYAVTGSTVVFTPSALLPPNRTVRVRVNTNQSFDFAGNGTQGATNTFSTADFGDVVKPTVVAVTPDDGATEVGRTTPVNFVFSEPLNPSTVNNDTIAVFSNGAEIGKSLSRSADNTSVTVSLTLQPNTEYAIVLTSGIQDLSGNTLDDFTTRFGTVSTFDTTRPSIAVARPPANATRVPADTTIVLYATEALDATTLDNGLFVSEDGLLVEGTITTDAGSSSIEFTPDAPFAPNAQIQVFATTAIRDLDGNALNSFQQTFRILPDPAAENGFLVESSPAISATDVPINAALEVRYSEPLDPANVNALRVRLFPSGTEQSGTITLLDNDTVVRFEPLGDMAPNLFHQLQLNGVTFADGGSVPFTNISFTTGPDADATAPSVSSISPPAGATNVGINTSVVVRFDEPINPLSVGTSGITLSGPSGELVPCTISFSNGDRNVTLVPHSPLFEQATHTIDVVGVEDLAGNPAAAAQSTFTTIAGVDIANPDVAQTNPANGASGVSTNTVLEVQLTETIDPASLRNDAIRLFPSGLAEASGTTSLAPDGRTLLFVPDEPLAVNLFHSYWVQFVTDNTGNSVPFRSRSFTTELLADLDGPQVIGVSPTDGLGAVPTNAEVVVEFDEAVSGVDLASKVELSAGGVPVPVFVSQDNGSRWVRLRPVLPLAANTLHTVDVDDVQDRAGNNQQAPFSSTFTTEAGVDLLRPSVSTFNPPNSSSGISTDTSIEIVFSERINPITVTSGSFTLRENVQFSNVSGTISVSADQLRAFFTPDEALAPFTSFTWSATGGILDLTGQTLSGISRSFTTGAGIDDVAPTVQTVSPPDLATDVPTNARVQVVMSETLDNLTVGAGDLQLLLGATPLAGSFSFDNSRTLTFTPDESLRGLETYTVSVDGFTDRVGNPVVPFTSTFTTRSIPDGNLARTTNKVITASSQFSSSFVPTRGADGDLNTEWCTASGDAVNQGGAPFWQVELPGPATVDELRIFGRRSTPNTPFLTVRLQLFAADDSELFNSGEVPLPAPDRDAIVNVGGVSGVTRVLFTSVLDSSNNPCFSELEVIGSFADPGDGQFDESSRPSVVTVTPSNGSSDVPLDSAIAIEWNRDVDPTTVNSSNVPITVDGFSGSLGGAYTVTGSLVTFQPAAPLPQGQTIRVRVNSNGVRDLADNGTNSSTTTFSTVALGDNTRPVVDDVFPMDGATDITRTTPITLRFSEPLNRGTVGNDTIALFANGSELGKNISVSSDNTAVTITATLPANTAIAVAATAGIRDLSGNALVPFNSSFETGGDLDLGRPSVTNVRPGSSATRVAADTTVVLFTTEQIDPATLPDGLLVSQEGVLVPGTFDTTAGIQTVEFVPDAPFQAGARIQVFATPSIRDLSGNALNNFQSTFTIAPDPAVENGFLVDTSPAVSSTDVPTNARLELRYSEPLDPSTVNASTFRLFPSGTEQSGTISLADGDRLVRFEPLGGMASDTFHQLQLNGASFADGGSVPFANLSFTTGSAVDNQAPSVTGVSPPDSADAVGVNTSVTVRFDEPVNPNTINGTTIEIAGPTGATVPCAISFGSGDRSVVVVPHTPLRDLSTYTVTVDGVTDVVGQPVATNVSTFDTIAGPDGVAPTVAIFRPPNGATGVGVDVVIEVEFTEIIDPATVRSDTIRVFPSGGVEPSGTITVGSDMRRVFFVPDDNLAPSVFHSIWVQFVQDTSSNQMPFRSFSFTTGTDSDTTPPSVVAVSPPDGLTDVPLDGRARVQFSEAVSDIGLSGAVVLSQAGTPVNAGVSLTAGDTEAVVVPRALLLPNTVYTLTVQNAVDRAGNIQTAPSVTTFTTGDDVDLTRPTIGSLRGTDAANPAINETDVGTNIDVDVRFSSRIDPITVDAGTFTLRDNSAGANVPGIVTVDPDLRGARFAPLAPINPSSSFTWSITSGITDLTGEALSGRSRNFSSGGSQDTDPPEVEVSSPEDGAINVPTNVSVSVRLDENLNQLTVGEGDLVLLDGATPVPGTFSVSGRTLSFVPDGSLDAATAYTISLGGFSDTENNAIVPVDLSFTTGTIPDANVQRADGVVATASSFFSSSFVPANGIDGSLTSDWCTSNGDAANLGTNPFYRIDFAGPADVDEIRFFGRRSTTSTAFVTGVFTLVDAADAELWNSGQINFPAPDRDIVVGTGGIAGASALIFESLADISNNPCLSELHVIGSYVDPRDGRFADVVRPSVSSTNPGGGATDVAVDAVITWTFTEQIDPLSVGSSTMPVRISGQQVAGTYETMGDTVTFTPTENWPAGAAVQILVNNNGPDDLAGNGSTSDNRTFTIVP